jgi:hypothetical protein
MARTRGKSEYVEAPPRYDSYFGMLVIAFIAMLAALVFLYLDYSTYSGKPSPQKATTTLGKSS